MSDLSAVESIFLAAVEKPSPEARAAYLNVACPDPEVRRHVERLLAAHPRVGNFLNDPAPALTEDHEPVTEGPGVVVGPYTLREQIGEGGMGLVFVAEQLQPVRRKVALKVIKPGMDSRQVVARFEAERQALALMDHPNIAKVLDAGTTDSGRPYFVMELVRGVPITEYADANNLTPKDRLGLFIQVCQAVQHAHQKGIIHRDLKPSNILVAPHDGIPVVKVIDFGVAKALGQSLTEKTIYTRFAQMIGTPLYMSPEQAEVNQLDVDTRSDVYSLGVLLYELLTGTTPFDRDRFRKAAFDEIRRIIKEEEPPRPSTRLTSLGATLTAVSAKRGTAPGRLAGLVRGELDWIVMKCLEKDRTRRYDSATGLAKDIQRYLAGDAVEACPPTLGYRLKKAYRRNRIAILAGGAFAFLLVVGAGLSAWQATRASIAEGNEKFHRQQAEKNLELAEGETDKANKSQADALRERDETRRAHYALRRSHYATTMSFIQSAWDADNLSRVIELLDELRPGPGEEDLRGFEWHYWDRLCHSEKRVVPVLGFAGPRTGTIHPPTPVSKGGFNPIRHRATLTALSGDGTRFAWWRESAKEAPSMPSIRIHDTATGAVIGSCPVPDVERMRSDWAPWSGSIVLNHDGSRLVLDGNDRVIVYDTMAGREITRIPGQFRAISPDGKRLAALVRESAPPPKVPGKDTPAPVASAVVKVFDLTEPTKAPIPLRCEPAEAVVGVAFNGDGSRLAGLVAKPIFDEGNRGGGSQRSAYTIQVWNPTTGEPLARVSAGENLQAFGPAFSPDGTRLALVCVEHKSGSPPAGPARLQLWRVTDGEIGQQLVVPWAQTPISQNQFRLRFAPDSISIVSINRSGSSLSPAEDGFESGRTIRVLDARNGTERQIVRSRIGMSAFGFTTQGTLLSVDSSQGAIREWSMSASASDRQRGGPPLPLTVVGHAGHRSAVYKLVLPKATIGVEIGIRDRDGKELHVFRGHAAPVSFGGVQFSPNDQLVLSASRDGLVNIWETETGKVRWSFQVPTTGTGLGVAPSKQMFGLGDSGRLVALPTERGMKIVEFDSLRELLMIDGATRVAFTPNAQRLLSWHADPTDPKQPLGRGELKLWDVQAEKVLWSGVIDSGPQIQFSPDGRMFALAKGADRQFELRDATTGLKRHDIPASPSPMASSFSGDGTRFVCLSPAGTYVVWDTETGKPVCRLTEVGSRSAPALSHDGKRVVTFSPNTIGPDARLWDAETGRELLRLAIPLDSNLTLRGAGLSFSLDGYRLEVPIDPWASSARRTLVDATPRAEPKR